LGPSDEARDGCSVDDAPPPGTLHVRHDSTRAQEWPGKIRGDHRVPVLIGMIEEGLYDAHANIVHKNVDTPEPTMCLICHRVHRSRAGHVGLQRNRFACCGDVFQRRLALRFVDIDDDDLRAFPGECDANCLPDAARTSCDNGDLVFQTHLQSAT
jgi:hypothetical protein